MDAAEILHTLSDQGFNVAIKGGALSIVPASRLSDSMRAEVRQHKPELVALLTSAANDTHTEPGSSIERLERLHEETSRMIESALRDAKIRANAEAIGNALESRLIEGAEALAKIQPDQARHQIWLIRAEHEVFSMGFGTPKTRAEVEAMYPGAEVEVRGRP